MTAQRRVDPEFFKKEEALLAVTSKLEGTWDNGAEFRARVRQDPMMVAAAVGAAALAGLSFVGFGMVPEMWEVRMFAVPVLLPLVVFLVVRFPLGINVTRAWYLSVLLSAVHLGGLLLLREAAHMPAQVGAALVESLLLAFFSVRWWSAAAASRATRLVRIEPLATVALFDRSKDFGTECWRE